MPHRFSAWLHAWLLTSIALVARRLRTAPQSGQGTVEYVALILLVAGVLAVAVASATKSNMGLEKIISTELKDAIGKVSK